MVFAGNVGRWKYDEPIFEPPEVAAGEAKLMAPKPGAAWRVEEENVRVVGGYEAMRAQEAGDLACSWRRSSCWLVRAETLSSLFSPTIAVWLTQILLMSAEV